MNLTVQDLLTVRSSTQVGIEALGLAKTFREVSTDSRTVKRGDLFVALRGEHFDGHEFLADAEKEGALAAIVDQKWFKANQKGRAKLTLPVIVVENTLNAYGELARHYRQKFSIPILVIAGSNGKTTTKELVAHVLSSMFGVLKTEANYNNQVGLPRMLFQLRDGHDVAVLELGTNHPGEIEWLVEVAQPTHALLTNIGHEHLEFFKDLKGVAKEETAALEWTALHGGTAFINIDDRFLKPFVQRFGERAVTFGLEAEAFVSAETTGFSKDARLELRVSAEGKSFRLRTHIVADYAPSLIAATVAVGLNFKLRRAEIKAAIEHFHPHDKRLEVVHVANGVTLLNDAYNANPESVGAALRTLKSYPAEGKRYAVLGDMFELGEASAKEHREIGKLAAELNLHHVYFVGAAMKAAAASYQRTATRPERGTYHATKSGIVDTLHDLLKPGDVLLVKGSRGMRMEELVEQLR